MDEVQINITNTRILRNFLRVLYRFDGLSRYFIYDRKTICGGAERVRREKF